MHGLLDINSDPIKSMRNRLNSIFHCFQDFFKLKDIIFLSESSIFGDSGAEILWHDKAPLSDLRIGSKRQLAKRQFASPENTESASPENTESASPENGTGNY